MPPGGSTRSHDPSFPQSQQRPTYLQSYPKASSSSSADQSTGLGIHYPVGNRLFDIVEGHDPIGYSQDTTINSTVPSAASADRRPTFHGSAVLLNDPERHPSRYSAPTLSTYSYQHPTPFYTSPLDQRQPDHAASRGFEADRNGQQPYISHLVEPGFTYPHSALPTRGPREVSPHSTYPLSPRSLAGNPLREEERSNNSYALQYPREPALNRIPSYASPHALPPSASASSFQSAYHAPHIERRPSDQQSFGHTSPDLGINNLPQPPTARNSQLAPPPHRPSLGAESTHSHHSSPRLYQLPPLPVTSSSLQAWRNSLVGYQPPSAGQGGPRTTTGGHSRNPSGDSVWSANGGYQVPAVPGPNPYRLLDPIPGHQVYQTRSRISSLASAQHDQAPIYTNHPFGLGSTIHGSSPYLPSPIQSPIAQTGSPFPHFIENDYNMPPRRSTNASASASVGMSASVGGAPESYMPPAGPTTRSRVARGIAAGSMFPSYADSARGSVISVGSSMQARAMSGVSQSSRFANGDYGNSHNMNGGYAEPRPPPSSTTATTSSRAIAGRSGLNGSTTMYRPVGQPRSTQAGPSGSHYRTSGAKVADNTGREHTVLEILESDDEQSSQAGPSTTRAGQKRKAVEPSSGASSASGKKKMRMDSGMDVSQYDQSQSQTGSRRVGTGAGNYRGNGTAGTTTSTATQSTLATTVGIAATEHAMANQINGHHRSARAANNATNGHGQTAAMRGAANAQVIGEGAGYGVDGQDDKDGHYVVTAGNNFGPGNRYLILRLLGQGTFGKVIEAREAYTSKKVAVKIIRAVQKYREASAIEIKVLEALKRHDPDNRNKCIHLLDTFDFRNHVCLVSELLGQSVYDFLKENAFMPFPEKHIQDFAKSLLKSLSYVHSLKLIHTDLKPENILLVENKYSDIGERRSGKNHRHILKNTDIRLIDFGSATFEGDFKSSVVCTRHYRAPEIILSLGWSFPCDLFSIGCILVEFYTGEALFQTHENIEHLAMMEVVMGKMPVGMANKAVLSEAQYFRGKKLDWPNTQTTKKSQRYVKEMRGLNQIIKPDTPLRHAFLDLCKKLLAFDPGRRLTVSQASQHPYLTEPAPNAPTQADVDSNGGSVWGHLKGCPPTIKGRG